MQANCGAIRAVVFDAVGTLLHPRASVASTYARVAAELGSRRTQAEIRSRFLPALRKQDQFDARQDWRTCEQRELQRWRDVVAEVLDDVADPQTCFQRLFDHFGQPEAWTSPDDLAEAFEHLRRRGLKLGIASNFDRRLHAILAASPALSQVPHVVISSEVGWRKPSPRFFEQVAEKLGLAPGEIAYLGDDGFNDVDGARQAGMAAQLYLPGEPLLAQVGRVLATAAEGGPNR